MYTPNELHKALSNFVAMDLDKLYALLYAGKFEEAGRFIDEHARDFIEDLDA